MGPGFFGFVKSFYFCFRLSRFVFCLIQKKELKEEEGKKGKDLEKLIRQNPKIKTQVRSNHRDIVY